MEMGYIDSARGDHYGCRVELGNGLCLFTVLCKHLPPQNTCEVLDTVLNTLTIM